MKRTGTSAKGVWPLALLALAAATTGCATSQPDAEQSYAARKAASHLAIGVDRMRALGIPLDSLRVTGGGAANSLWCQILANVLELPLQPLGPGNLSDDLGHIQRVTGLSGPWEEFPEPRLAVGRVMEIPQLDEIGQVP